MKSDPKKTRVTPVITEGNKLYLISRHSEMQGKDALQGEAQFVSPTPLDTHHR